VRARAEANAAADRADAAVRAGEAHEADDLLRHAEERIDEADDPPLAARVAGLRAHADVLRLLDEAVERRWAVSGAKTNAELARPAFEAAFARGGLAVGGIPPAEFAAAVRASRVADRLLAGLHDWLEADPDRPGLVDAANAVDPDPVRSAVRSAVARKDKAKVRELMSGLDGATLPPSFAALVGTSMLLAPADAERLLTAAAARHPASFSLAIAAGAMTVRPQTPLAVAVGTGYFRTAVALRPENVRARMMLSTALAVAGDWPAAVAEAERAVALAPDAPRPRANLGDVLTKAGRADEAEAAYRAAIDRVGAGPPAAAAAAHSGIGNLRYARGDYAGAVEAYRAAAAAAPADGSTRTYIGDALEAAGDLAGGLAEIEAAVRADPANGYARFRLGLAYHQRGRHRKAALIGHPTVAESPQPAAAFQALGLTLTEAGDFAGAARAYARAAAVTPAGDPSRSTLDFMADRAKRTAEQAAALAAGRTLPDPSPTDLYGLAVRADVLRGRGEDAAAAVMYERLFAATGKAGVDLSTGFELPAARTAARAARGGDRRFRDLALRWLRGEARRLATQAGGPTAEVRVAARRSAALLLASDDFAPLRAGVPADERSAWDALWESLVRTAGGREAAPPPRPR
jgi:tetratricopeptide (TPR) repeat protein